MSGFLSRKSSAHGVALRIAAVSVAASTVVAGCSTSSTPPSNGGSGGGGATALTVDLGAYPASLDPGLQYDTSSYSVYRNMFDQLLHRDPQTRKVIPWLATSWKQQSPTKWVFTMRKGVKFSDGSSLTAADAAFSIERILDPKTASQQAANFSAISSATASGDRLTITTKFPSPTLLSFLTTLSVVPKAYVNKVGKDAFNQKPMGSGPYKLVSAIQGSQVKLTANPDYWGAKPSIKDVTFRAVTAVSSRVSDLQSGRAQIALGITPDAAKQVKSSNKLQVLATSTERVSYLAFNTLGGGAVTDVNVRKAISLGINYSSLIKDLEGGYAKPVNSVLTPFNLGYDKSLRNFKYDPTEAKKLVKQAGATDKTVVMATSPSYDPNIVQAIQADIQAIGLKVKIVNTDQATYLQKVQSPTHDWGAIRFGQWSCSCMDADGTIYPLFRTGTIWSSYSNKTYDGLVDGARRTTNATDRTSDYSKALTLLNKEMPGIGLFQVQAIYGASKKLRFSPDAQEDFFVATMKLSS